MSLQKTILVTILISINLTLAFLDTVIKAEGIPTVEPEGSAKPNNNINNDDVNKDFENDEYYKVLRSFNEEWESKMSDYDSDYSYNIPLKRRIAEVFYENVTQVPCHFRGAFIIAEETMDKVEFIIKDPNGQEIINIVEHHNIFNLPIRYPGRYTISFNNKVAKSDIVVTFTMTTEQNKILNAKDLTNTEKKLEDLSAVIKKFNLEFKLGHDIHFRRYQSKLYIFYFCFNL